MWDTVGDTADETASHLSHDMPCQRCGHAIHTFLSCDDCECAPAAMPGDALRVAV